MLWTMGPKETTSGPQAIRCNKNHPWIPGLVALGEGRGHNSSSQGKMSQWPWFLLPRVTIFYGGPSGNGTSRLFNNVKECLPEISEPKQKDWDVKNNVSTLGKVVVVMPHASGEIFEPGVRKSRGSLITGGLDPSTVPCPPIPALWFRGAHRWAGQQPRHSVSKPGPTLRDPMDCSNARLPCPSPSPGVCSNSCPWNPWCHPIISPSVVPFPSALGSSVGSRISPKKRFADRRTWLEEKVRFTHPVGKPLLKCFRSIKGVRGSYPCL